MIKYDFRKIKKGQGIKTEKNYSDETLRYYTVNLDRESRGSLGYAYMHHHKKGSIKKLRRELKPFKKVFKKLKKKFASTYR